MARLGLAGVGRIGAFHAETLYGLAEVEELVITDADPARARAVAQALGSGARWVADPDELFAVGLDGVAIAAPTGAHAALITRAVQAGLPVFCEKPVAPSGAETAEVVALVEKAGGRVQIGFQRRFDAGYRAARTAVAEGAVGWVHTLRGGTFDPAPPPAEYIATSGGIFRDCGVHDYDIVRWVTGREAVEVYATGSNQGERFFADAGDVDTAAAVVTMDDGALALLSAGRYNAAGYDVRLEVFGSRDSIAVGFDERLPMHSVEQGIGWPTGPAYPGFMDRFREAYVSELSAFVEFAAGRIDSPCTVADALEAIYIAEACELSRAEGRPVRIDEVRVAGAGSNGAVSGTEQGA
jgi:myo-inositol 2-dehydrogenase / D-chiro-inositol 1-dehydrogenase